uniref:Uncharacterized protein n=1 Tax=Cacopsylla melanoneura TaxID=428564 RepID=A0A8D9E338_9HEMI
MLMSSSEWICAKLSLETGLYAMSSFFFWQSFCQDFGCSFEVVDFGNHSSSSFRHCHLSGKLVWLGDLKQGLAGGPKTCVVLYHLPESSSYDYSRMGCIPN